MQAVVGMSAMRGMVPAVAAGVDPATDGNVTAVWDYGDALTDVDGVYQVTASVGSDHLAQATGSLKPALDADGIAPDGSDDTLVASGNASRLAVAASVIVLGIETPASIGTNSSPTGAINEAVFSDNNPFWAVQLKSTPPVLVGLGYDGSYKAVTVPISLSTKYAVALRWDSSNLGITLDGVSWSEASIGALDGIGSSTEVFKKGAGAASAVRFMYAATFNATKSDAEVQDFLTWITANKLP